MNSNEFAPGQSGDINWKAPETGYQKQEFATIPKLILDNEVGKDNIAGIFNQSGQYLSALNMPTYYSQAECSKMQDNIALNLQKIDRFEPDKYIALTEKMKDSVPAYFLLMFIASTPLERMNLNSNQKKELGVLAFSKLAEMKEKSDTDKLEEYKHKERAKSSLMKPNIVDNNGQGFSNFRMIKDLNLSQAVEQIADDAKINSIYLRDGDKYKSYTFNDLTILRALSRHGLLDMDNYIDPNTKLKLEDKLTSLVERSLIDSLKLKRASGKDTVSPSRGDVFTNLSVPPATINYGGGKFIDGQVCRNNMAINLNYDGQKRDKSVVRSMLGINHGSNGPVTDYRFNFHFKDMADGEKVANELSPAIASAFMEGHPIFVKQTKPDDFAERDGHTSRFMFYTDIPLIKSIVHSLKLSNYSNAQNPVMRKIDGEDILFPFGEDVPISVRGSHEDTSDRDDAQKLAEEQSNRRDFSDIMRFISENN